MSLYPVNLKIKDKLCLVVGGGPVALRKVQSLCKCGASIRVISPMVEPEIFAMARKKEIEWFERGYAEGDLKGVFLAFAATNDNLAQELVRQDAASHGVLLNCVDDPQGSHFHVPAHFRRGKMLVTVSTEGGSPALSKVIRKQLEATIVAEYGSVVDLMAMIRAEVVSVDGDSTTNRELFNTLLKKGVAELILKENWFELQMLLLQELPEDIDAVSLLRQFLEKHDKA